MDDRDVVEFLKFRGHLDSVNWSATPPKGKRAEVLSSGPSVRAPCLQEEGQAFTWEDIDAGPPESDNSWEAFASKKGDGRDGKLLASGGKKLTKEQKQKLKDFEQLADARESIRRRGWTEGEVKWRSWLARRGHDVQVNDWNLHKYIDGECIPPSRDPFWLNANEVPLPDYETGNDVPNEVGPMEITGILGERIEPKCKPARAPQLRPLWQDVDGADLVERGALVFFASGAARPPSLPRAARRDPPPPLSLCAGLGRVTETYYWRQTISSVVLEVKVPVGTSARDLTVVIEPKRLSIAIGHEAPLFDEQLHMRIYVGSAADNEASIWELQDKQWTLERALNLRHARSRALLTNPSALDSRYCCRHAGLSCLI